MHDIDGLIRNDHIHSERIYYLIAGLSLLLIVVGCSHKVADHHVRDTISAYFRTRNIQVVRMEIKNIEREPLGARKYMGPERHIVHISLITLKPMKTQTKSEDYQNVTITVRKNTDSLYGFSIDNISGIPWGM